MNIKDWLNRGYRREVLHDAKRVITVILSKPRN